MIDPHALFEVENVETFEVLNNPLRLRMLRNLKEPTSVKALAARLGVPPTRLYYHVNLMESAGILVVAETHKVGAMVEKRYQRTANRFAVSPKLAREVDDPAQMARVGVGIVLDSTRVDAEAALAREIGGLARGETDEHHDRGRLGRGFAHLDPERMKLVEAKVDELFQLLEELDTGGEGVEFGLTVAFVPVAGTEEQE